MSKTVDTAVFKDAVVMGVLGGVKLVLLKLVDVTPSFAAAMLVSAETPTDLSCAEVTLGSTAIKASEVLNATGCIVRSSR